jgi:Fic family protein
VAAEPLKTPLLCPPERKAELEARNAVEQLDYIAYLVNRLGLRQIRESHIRELHAIAIKDIYPCGGKYRNATMRVKIDGSRHELPHESRVPSLIWDLIENINHPPPKWVYLNCAAYALWRLNWIHPFAGGNGRTARALCYLIVCAGFGSALPGVPSMPALIARGRTKYMKCLRAADEAEETGSSDFPDMLVFVMEIVTKQFISALRQKRN